MQLPVLKHTTARQRRSLSAHSLVHKLPVVAGAERISRRAMPTIKDVNIPNYWLESNGLAPLAALPAWVTAFPRDIFVHRVAEEGSQLCTRLRKGT